MPRTSCPSLGLGKFIGYDTGALRAALRLLLVASLAFAQTQLQQAVLLSRAGRFAEARQAIAGVPLPSAVPQQIAYHRLKAAIASGLGENSAAAQEMEAALQLAPSDASLLLGTAVAALHAGQLQTSVRLLERAGDNSDAKELLGEILEKQGHSSESIKAYREAVSLNGEKQIYRTALAKELIAVGAFEPALTELQGAIAKFPKSGELLTLLGILKYAGGQPAKAEESLTRAIHADPSYEPAYRCLAKVVLESSGTPGQPEIDALCKWSDIACSAVQVRVARDTGDRKLQEHAMAVLARAPSNDPLAACALGQAYVWSGRPADARPKLELCVEKDPTPQNHYRLAQVYQKLGESKLARQQLDARSKLLENMSEQTAKAVDSLKSLEAQAK